MYGVILNMGNGFFFLVHCSTESRLRDFAALEARKLSAGIRGTRWLVTYLHTYLTGKVADWRLSYYHSTELSAYIFSTRNQSVDRKIGRRHAGTGHRWRRARSRRSARFPAGRHTGGQLGGIKDTKTIGEAILNK